MESPSGCCVIWQSPLTLAVTHVMWLGQVSLYQTVWRAFRNHEFLQIKGSALVLSVAITPTIFIILFDNLILMSSQVIYTVLFNNVDCFKAALQWKYEITVTEIVLALQQLLNKVIVKLWPGGVRYLKEL